MSDTDSHKNSKPEYENRSYQTEILEKAKTQNTIVCLPTGSGKTYIAVMLIKEMSADLQLPLENGGKRTIVLVATKTLASQHEDTLNEHLALNVLYVCCLSKINKKQNLNDSTVHNCGSKKINLRDQSTWNKIFCENHVLIFTAQKFLDLLHHNCFSLDKVNLLVFDECHHATGDNPYARIMKDHYSSCSHAPHILGLTASLCGQKLKPEQLSKEARKLEGILRAHIETGSNRIEIIEHSTSVTPKYERCKNFQDTCSRNPDAKSVLQKITSLIEKLDRFLKAEKDILLVDDFSQNDRLNSVHLVCRSFSQLKSHLDNIVNVAYDVGICGLHSGVTELIEKIQSGNRFESFSNKKAQDMYKEIQQELNSIKTNSEKLLDNAEVRCSEKLTILERYIRDNTSDQCIVFVDRVYTAAILCKILEKKLENITTVKCLTGSKPSIDGFSSSQKAQTLVARDFRENTIRVLIATAVIEEGFDVPECNLVIRFNKPSNFSSYMQSKGRARARATKASFVVFRDERSREESRQNTEEYDNYEFTEKSLRRDFKISRSDDSVSSSSSSDVNDSDDDADRNKRFRRCYRTDSGAKIYGIRAVQIINEYCAILGRSQILCPQFSFSNEEGNKFKCTLSMPTNCPVQEETSFTHRNKRTAQRQCCLQMIELLYKKGELDQKQCLPIRFDEDSASSDDTSDDEENNAEKIKCETVRKQTAYFCHDDDSALSGWHLYRINDDLGFVVPDATIKLPKFKLYGRDGEFTVAVIYLKPIDMQLRRAQLEAFCQYIFERGFYDMSTTINSCLKFNTEHTTFKLLPCLLKMDSHDIDFERMDMIRNREQKPIQNLAALNENELYCDRYGSKREIYRYYPDESVMKKTSDVWTHKKQEDQVKTYAEHFEQKVSGIHIQRDRHMATMVNFQKPRVNYLKDSPLKSEKESGTSQLNFRYLPIEFLCYAPLNQKDLELIYKLPSILVRIVQLYYIENLRKLLTTSVQSCTLFDVASVSTITFRDCLTHIFTSGSSSVLPLTQLNYDRLSVKTSELQLPSSLIFQAITRHSANEHIDMENLEILGDCFLKLATFLSLYHKYPSGGPGKLTTVKDKQVSNKNLYRLAKKNNLLEYLYADCVTYTGNGANWIPPGYMIDGSASVKYTGQTVKLKAFADMMEAFFGAYLVSNDYMATIKFMSSLGLDTLPTTTESYQTIRTPSILHQGLSITTESTREKIEKIYQKYQFELVEKEIKYTFKDKSYLIAAFTHPSYTANRVTLCYERLEYLGDAVLDFLVVRCIFVEFYDKVTPSRVTNLRQDLSNNGRLADMLTGLGLHKFILHKSPHLFDELTSYQKRKPIDNNNSTLENGMNLDKWADPEAPKALADVFEAMIGGVFLDSGYSLRVAWDVIEPLLRPYIGPAISRNNLHPVRSFTEQGGEIISNVVNKNGTYSCTVVFDGHQFSETKKTKKLAKYRACQLALSGTPLGE